MILDDKNIEEISINFEKKYGSIIFVKIVVSVLTQILAENGLTTEEKLREKFIETIAEFEKETKDLKK
jgi:hypothetical protein